VARSNYEAVKENVGFKFSYLIFDEHILTAYVQGITLNSQNHGNHVFRPFKGRSGYPSSDPTNVDFF
jgi:hypothetical protein